MKKKLNVAALKSANAFIDKSAIPVEVQFEIDGVEHEYQVYCRKFRFDTFTGLDQGENASVNMVYKGIVNEDGTDFFKYEEACSLHPNLAAALVKAVVEVNTFKKKS